mmetsp:Transcript_55562/g.131938  ORF Transcript_55562/g.131938 Transcript_55562/m.131938 type:complete len:234 (+) Transcript_55562:131-832(+)
MPRFKTASRTNSSKYFVRTAKRASSASDLRMAACSLSGHTALANLAAYGSSMYEWFIAVTAARLAAMAPAVAVMLIPVSSKYFCAPVLAVSSPLSSAAFISPAGSNIGTGMAGGAPVGASQAGAAGRCCFSSSEIASSREARSSSSCGHHLFGGVLAPAASASACASASLGSWFRKDRKSAFFVSACRSSEDVGTFVGSSTALSTSTAGALPPRRDRCSPLLPNPLRVPPALI